MSLALAIAALVLAGVPLAVYLLNIPRYRPLARETADDAVSVLVPARDEEASIGGLIESVLSDPGCPVELIVLDDHSGDRTADVITSAAAADPRVRLVRGQPLPPGWCGKQFACSQLADAASHDTWVFLDADVRVESLAIGRLVAKRDRTGLDLLSGVPRQVFSATLDRLLIPLIHFVLLGYLPLRRADRSTAPAYAAGCGQVFVTTRAAYRAAGGHAAIRETMHDGLRLPRLYREAGLRTGLADLTDAASCAMYASDAEVWPGLSKNAVEGIGSPGRIVPFTVLLIGGHVMPWLLLPWQPVVAGLACGASLLPRVHAAARFRQPVWTALLHPLAVSVFLAIQWAALGRHLLGRQTRWKGRGVTPADA